MTGDIVFLYQNVWVNRISSTSKRITTRENNNIFVVIYGGTHFFTENVILTLSPPINCCLLNFSSASIFKVLQYRSNLVKM